MGSGLYRGLFSSEDNIPIQILRDNDKRLILTANRIPLSYGLASNTTTPTINPSVYTAKEEQKNDCNSNGGRIK